MPGSEQALWEKGESAAKIAASPPASPRRVECDVDGSLSQTASSYVDVPMTPPSDEVFCLADEKGASVCMEDGSGSFVSAFETSLRLDTSRKAKTANATDLGHTPYRIRSKSSKRERNDSLHAQSRRPKTSKFHRPSPQHILITSKYRMCGSKSLPLELWAATFAYLPPLSILRIMQTCRYFCRIGNDGVLWRMKCEEASINCEAVISECQARGVKYEEISHQPNNLYPWSPFAQGENFFHFRQQPVNFLVLSWKCVWEVSYRYRSLWLSGQHEFSRFVPHSHGVTSIVVASCNDRCPSLLITGSWDNNLCLWTPITREMFETRPEADMNEDPIEGSWWGQNRNLDSSDANDSIAFRDLAYYDERHENDNSRTSRIGARPVGKARSSLKLSSVINCRGSVECVHVKGDLVFVGERASSASGSVSVYSLSRQSCLRNFIPDVIMGTVSAEPVTSIDTRLNVLVASSKSNIMAWDIHSGRQIAYMTRHGANITSVRALDAEIVVECCALGNVHIWKLETSSTSHGFESNKIDTMVKSECMRLLHSIYVGPGALCLYVMEMGKAFEILCGFKDGTLRAWHCKLKADKEIDGVTPAYNLTSLSDWITCVHVDCMTDIVAAGSWDGRVRLWDRRTGALKRTLLSDSRSAVLSITVMAGILIVGKYDGSVVLHEFGKSLSNKTDDC